jgi:hypothetical protein
LHDLNVAVHPSAGHLPSKILALALGRGWKSSLNAGVDAAVPGMAMISAVR